MKIEIEKPVIPKFVADWIEQLYGQGFDNDDLLEALFSRNYEVAELKIFDWFTDDKERAVTAILYGYEVEPEPLYYAKIKGWEHVGTSSYYFGYDEDNDSLEVTYLESNYRFAFSLTKKHWNRLGIDDTNADFEEVEVWEVDISETYQNGGENGKQ